MCLHEASPGWNPSLHSTRRSPGYKGPVPLRKNVQHKIKKRFYLTQEAELLLTCSLLAELKDVFFFQLLNFDVNIL